MAMTSVPGTRIWNENNTKESVKARKKAWLRLWLRFLLFMIYEHEHRAIKIILICRDLVLLFDASSARNHERYRRRWGYIFRCVIFLGTCMMWMGVMRWYGVCHIQQMPTKLEQWKIDFQRALDIFFRGNEYFMMESIKPFAHEQFIVGYAFRTNNIIYQKNTRR